MTEPTPHARPGRRKPRHDQGPRRGDGGRLRRRLARRAAGRPDVDGAAVGPPDGACRGRQGGPQARAADQPRGLRGRRPARDPIAILAAQEEDRLQQLVPLRHERMAESPFAYYRGTPAVMAFDLAATPRTDILVQASGDAHLSNFGLFASPERTLVFDANDFDETLPGPWEWDVKRLAASVVIAGRANGFSAAAEPRRRRWPAVRSYRQWMARYASMRLLDVWYASITDADIREAAEATGLAPGPRRRPAGARGSRPSSRKARRRDGMRAFESLTARRRRAPGHPRGPAGRHARRDRGRPGRPREGLHRLPGDDAREPARLPRALPLRRLRPQGRRRRERRHPLLHHRPPGPRRERPAHPPGQGGDGLGPGAVPAGRACTPTTASASSSASSSCRPPPTSSWAGRAGPGGRDFYIRQLWDMKGSVDTTTLQPRRPRLLRRRSAAGPWPGRTRGRGDAVAISAYLGHERHVRRRDRRLRRDLRRRQRARPRGLPGRDRGGPRLGARSGDLSRRPGRDRLAPAGQDRLAAEEPVGEPEAGHAHDRGHDGGDDVLLRRRTGSR